jgi:hypothetical protein
MNSIEGAHPKWGLWVGPVALLVAAGVAGLWLWLTQAAYVPLWPALGLVAMTAALAVAWLSRVRGANRRFAALNAYAERQLAGTRRRRHTPSVTGNGALAK